MNWSFAELKEVIEDVRSRGSEFISIEHSENDVKVEYWLAKMGLKFKKEIGRTFIYLT